MKKYTRWIIIALVLVLLLTGCKKKENVEPETTATENKDIFDDLADLARQQAEALGINSYLNLINLKVEANKESLNYLAEPLQSALDAGARTESDINLILEPGRSSGAIELKIGACKATVRVTNIKAEEAQIKDCIITHFEISEIDATLAGKFAIGIAKKDQIRSYFGTPFKEDENTLIYRVSLFAAGKTKELEEILKSSGTFGNIREEVKFTFAEDVLTAVSLDIPFFLYQKLQDNVAPDKLEEMTQEELEKAVERRDTILNALLAAFKEQGLSASISERTGEVVLDDSLLFGNEEYELKEEGKAFIEKVSKAYASVILGDYIGEIDEIVFEGHTNNLGTYEYNLELSQKRAESVMDYFIHNGKNDLTENQKAKLKMLCTAKGFSFTDPIIDEKGAIDMKASRRVSVKFYIRTDN